MQKYFLFLFLKIKVPLYIQNAFKTWYWHFVPAKILWLPLNQPNVISCQCSQIIGWTHFPRGGPQGNGTSWMKNSQVASLGPINLMVPTKDAWYQIRVSHKVTVRVIVLLKIGCICLLYYNWLIQDACYRIRVPYKVTVRIIVLSKLGCLSLLNYHWLTYMVASLNMW